MSHVFDRKLRQQPHESRLSSENLEKVQLRPYQEEAVGECLDSIANGVTRIGVSSPTGSGKTTMFTELIARLPALQRVDSPAPGTNVLIVVNSAELASQAAGAVSRAYPKLLVEIEQGQKFRASGLADVTVATYQSLVRGEGRRLEKYHPQSFKAVIVDEAHHAASRSYITVLSHFDEDIGLTRDEKESRAASAAQETSHSSSSDEKSKRKVPIIGFSATFARHDGLALSRVFDRIVFHRDFLSMIDEQWLCPVRFTSIRSDLDLSKVAISKATGDFTPRSLSQQTNTPAINRLIVRTWLDRAAGRRSTLIFCADVAHTIDLTTEFRQAGVDARYLHGGTTAKERKQLLEGFKQGAFNVLINCAILTEGFDLPQIDTVVLAKPTRSRNLFSQMIGRGLRQSPSTDKLDCLVLDLVGSIDRGVVCTPTLFGLDLEDVIDGATLDELKKTAGERKGLGSQEKGDGTIEDVDPEKVTFIDYESPHELQQALIQRGEGRIAKLSPNAWVHCGSNIYVLEIPRKGFIRIQPSKPTDQHVNPMRNGESETWSATFTPVNPDIDQVMAMAEEQRGQGKAPRGFFPFRRPRAIFGAEPAPNLEVCVRACDTYALKRILFAKRPEHQLIRRDAEWRKRAASDSQRDLVASRIGHCTLENSFGGLEIRTKTAVEIADEQERQQKKERMLASLTKGKAADILTKLRHGFRRRWRETARASNRAAAARIEEIRRRQRETVKVGNL